MRRVWGALLGPLLHAGCALPPMPGERLEVRILARTADAPADAPGAAPALAPGFVLKQEALLDLGGSTAGAPLPLPGTSPLRIVPLGRTENGGMRLSIQVAPPALATTLVVAPGATVAIGGVPSHDATLMVVLIFRDG